MIRNVLSSVGEFFDFNQSILSDSMDIIVIEHENGEYKSTPFHVRFGKSKLLKSAENTVRIKVNDILIEDVTMQLGHGGAAAFVEERIDVVEEGFETSPIASPIMSPISSPIGDSFRMAASTPDNLNPSLLDALCFNDEQDKDSSSAPECTPVDESLDLGDLSQPHVFEAAQKDVLVGHCLDDPEIPFIQGEGSECESIRSGLHTIVDDDSPDSDPASNDEERTKKLDRSDSRWHWDWGEVPKKEKVEKTKEQDKCSRNSGRISGKKRDSVRSRDTERSTKTEQKEVQCDTDVCNTGLSEPKLELSLCADLLMCRTDSVAEDKSVFERELITFGQMDENPEFWSHPSLVLRIGENPPYYRGKVIMPMISSWKIFGRPLSHAAILRLSDDKPKAGSKWTSWFSSNSPDPPILPLPLSDSGPESSPESLPDAVQSGPESESGADPERSKRVTKNLRPGHDQLKCFNLKPGVNTITFTVISSLQGEQSVTAKVYLWKSNAKIVISDIDGTITRSDVLGHIMPVIGRDWSHEGVTSLFSGIEDNGYNMVYLTARPIGQASQTRSYLQNLKQGEEQCLPDGPVLLSPDRLLKSFRREVIDRIPYEFKVTALRDLRALFPNEHNPFYAGFGNRTTDHRAYVHVGIPELKVFIIDPQGKITTLNNAYSSSYNEIGKLVDRMFPPVDVNTTDDQYNNFNYWRPPMDLLDFSDSDDDT